MFHTALKLETFPLPASDNKGSEAIAVFCFMASFTVSKPENGNKRSSM